MSLILEARQRTFVTIDHEIFSTVRGSPSSTDSRRVVSCKQKYVHRVPVGKPLSLECG